MIDVKVIFLDIDGVLNSARFDREKEDVHAGGSGCGCSATMLSAYVLEKLKAGEWKRVLFVPTGALLSKLRSEEGMTIPAIAHGVVLEYC